MFDNLQVIPGEAFTAAGSVIEKIIDKVSDATGWVVMPKGNHRNFLEAEEYLIEQIKNDENMPPLAKAASISKVRKLIKEYTNQQSILSTAIPYITDNAKLDDVDDDWLSYFFDKAKNISKDDMQIIWAKLLARELDHPNCVSKQLLHILSVIDYKEATAFKKLANFTVLIDDQPYVMFWFELFNKFYSKIGLQQEDIFALEDIGLIQESMDGYKVQISEKTEKIKYFDLEIDVEASESIALGDIALSRAGMELMSIIADKTKVNGFEDIVINSIGKDMLQMSEYINEKFK